MSRLRTSPASATERTPREFPLHIPRDNGSFQFECRECLSAHPCTFFQLDRRICLIPSLSSRVHRCAWRAFFSPAPAKPSEFLRGRDFQTRRRPSRQLEECSDIPWAPWDLPHGEDRFWVLYPAWHSEPPTSSRDA